MSFFGTNVISFFNSNFYRYYNVINIKIISMRRITGAKHSQALLSKGTRCKKGSGTNANHEETAHDQASQVCHSTPNQTESVKNLSSGHNANRVLTLGFYPHVEIKPNRKKKGGG